jgi:predicted small lipoprotein YifL
MDSRHRLRYKEATNPHSGPLLMLRRLVIFAVLAGLLTACGIRGPLEPPPGTEPDDQKKNPDFILDPVL